MDIEKYSFMSKIDFDSEEGEFIKEIRDELEAKEEKIKELEDKLKENQFEVIAKGKIIIEEKAVWLNCDVLIGGIFIAFKLKKYKGKNIQIGVREIEKI